MLKRLGEMLEWAGFGAEAARTYLEAAESADTWQRAEFERAAAEQLLTCGRIDDGAEVLRRALATAGLRTPRSPLRAVFAFLFYRLWVAIAGLRFEERPTDDLTRRERLRLDALFAAGLGFAIVDVVVGACIQARYLAMALRAGDRAHVLRASLLVSTQYANGGGPERGRERALRAVAQGLIDRTDDSEMHAFFHGSRGVGLFLRGRWSAALEVLDKAATEYPNNRAGWQSNVNLFGVYALLYLGRLPELAERHERLLREAEQRGDLYTGVNLRLAPSKTLALAADDPETARRHAREAMTQWSQRSYLVQHWQAMRVEAEVDLYVGDASGAYACIERDAPALAKSMLLKGQFTRVLMTELRGRCAVAVASAVPELRARRLAEARRCAHLLAREEMPYATLFAATLRAGIEAVKGNAGEADAWLHTAIGLADESGMVLHASAARRALGRLRGGAAGEDLVRRADAALEALGVRAPERFGAPLVPGFGPRT
jgi:tetratricopeptide (TPR) repeat protein